MSWTSTKDFKERVTSAWEKGRYFSLAEINLPASPEAAPCPEPPLRYPLRGPTAAELLNAFTEASRWTKSWQEHAATHSLELEWQEKAHRQLGRNSLPRAVIFANTKALARYLGREKEYGLWKELATRLASRFPALATWAARKPFELLAIEDRLDALMDLSDWFIANPHSGLYLRQVSVPGIDTKCIESHKGLLRRWWDILVPPLGERAASGSIRFEARYGFREKPLLIRFRVLDPASKLSGYRDLSIPADEFACEALPFKRVFIVENDISALAFPPVPDSIVIFGRGYGFDALAQAAWLAKRELWYWGDIDSNGFAILDQFRSHFPAVRSFLMDRETLLSNREKWVTEAARTRRELPRLDAAERSLYETLLDDSLAPKVRLEQELIPWNRILETLKKLVD